MAGLPAFYFFMVDVMTDMGTDVLGSCVGNLDVGLFVMSVVISLGGVVFILFYFNN